MKPTPTPQTTTNAAAPHERTDCVGPGRQSLARRAIGGTLSCGMLRELVFPTLFVLAGISSLVLTVDLVTYSDLAMNRGFGAGNVAWLALLRSIPTIGRAIPFAVLIGVLVALGRMGADREIIALEASGITARALGLPVTVFALGFCAMGLSLSLVASPWSHQHLGSALREVAAGDTGTPLRSGEILHLGDWRLVAREVSSRGDRLRAVAIRAPSVGGTIFAEQAAFFRERDGSRAITIENGIVVNDMTSADGEPTQLSFKRMRQTLPDPPLYDLSAKSWSSAASLLELADAIGGAGSPTLRRESAREWHQRFALPVGAVVFAWLALALSLAPEKPSRSSGVVLGIVALVAYYGLLQLGYGLARSENFPVWLAIWLPNLVLSLVALILIATLYRRRAGSSGRRGTPRQARFRPPHSAKSRICSFVLERYLLRTFGKLLLLCFAGLLAAYFIIDLLDNLKWFTQYRSSLDEILRFYAARVPLLASRVIPMALLVASALTLSLLGATGELVGMRACGVPTSRIVAPVLVACFVIAVAYHPFANDVVPHASARAAAIKHLEIKNEGSLRVSVWSFSGDRLLEAARIDPTAGRATGVVLYEIGPNGFPHRRTQAARALHVGDGNWRLEEPARFAIGEDGIRVVASNPIVHLGGGSVFELEGEHLSVQDLRREIRVLTESGLDSRTFRVDLARRLASPFACLLLPALALLFAVGGPPFPTPAQTLIASAAASGGWGLLAAAGASLGYGGAISPWLAGFGPVAVLSAVAAFLATRAGFEGGFAPAAGWGDPS